MVYVFRSIHYDFFFFFKQKTAYEMRISDWSSDVCSSDLPSILGASFLVMGKVDGRAATQKPNYNVEGWLVDLSPEERGDVWRKIGRASCRERVCQYV